MPQVPRTKRGRRQLRLVACGCCRLIWEHFCDGALTGAVVIAERFADGQADKEDLRVAGASFSTDVSSPTMTLRNPEFSRRSAAGPCICRRLRRAPMPRHSAARFQTSSIGRLSRNACRWRTLLICDVIRDIFGNPFRPVTFDPAWRTSTAVAIAKGMYDSRDFSAMPILADALQDAGCDNDDVLDPLPQRERASTSAAAGSSIWYLGRVERLHFPTSHTSAVVSCEPVTSVLPSVAKTATEGLPDIPVSVLIALPDSRSTSTTVPLGVVPITAAEQDRRRLAVRAHHGWRRLLALPSDFEFAQSSSRSCNR